eukprot:1195379-Prorocentrum_minimum.AAC.8
MWSFRTGGAGKDCARALRGLADGRLDSPEELSLSQWHAWREHLPAAGANGMLGGSVCPQRCPVSLSHLPPPALDVISFPTLVTALAVRNMVRWLVGRSRPDAYKRLKLHVSEC